MARANTDIEMQFATDTMNAVPIPRFGVGARLLAAQLLDDAGCKNIHISENHIIGIPRGRPLPTCPHLHDERKQRVSTAYNQVTRKVAHAVRFLCLES